MNLVVQNILYGLPLMACLQGGSQMGTWPLQSYDKIDDTGKQNPVCFCYQQGKIIQDYFIKHSPYMSWYNDTIFLQVFLRNGGFCF